MKADSTTICKLVDLIPALRQSDCRIPDGDEQRYKMLKTQVSIAFCKIVIVVEYKLTTYTVCAVVVGTAIRLSTRCAGRRGRKRPSDGQHNSCCCRIAVPTTPAQTVSWSIPIMNMWEKVKAGLQYMLSIWHMRTDSFDMTDNIHVS